MYAHAPKYYIVKMEHVWSYISKDFQNVAVFKVNSTQLFDFCVSSSNMCTA